MFECSHYNPMSLHVPTYHVKHSAAASAEQHPSLEDHAVQVGWPSQEASREAGQPVAVYE